MHSNGLAQVLGNVCYFLALLILSFGWDNSHVAKAINVVSIAAAIGVGSVFHITSMTNTACTFGVLFAMSCQSLIDWKGAIVAVMFANFIVLYFIAHFLSTHPEYVAAMFDAKEMYYV